MWVQPEGSQDQGAGPGALGSVLGLTLGHCVHLPVPSLSESVSSLRPVCRVPWLSSCPEKPVGL